MTSELTVTAPHDGSLSAGGVHDALTGLDVSKSSPVSANGREVGVTVTDEEVTLAVTGHDGDFTKKSEAAVVNALHGLAAVDTDGIEVEGGYTTNDSDGE